MHGHTNIKNRYTYFSHLSRSVNTFMLIVTLSFKFILLCVIVRLSSFVLKQYCIN